MANTTVYPFGTGGSLPSSIAVIDDLITGGANKALSAQQGVVLSGMISDVSESSVNTTIEIALSSMPVFPGVLVSDGTWSSKTTGHSYTQIPVKPGEKYRITSNKTANSYYTFFESVSFYSASVAPNYTDGYDNRISIETDTTVDITIPSGTSYLYIALTNASANQAPQGIYRIAKNSDILNEAVSNNYRNIVGERIELCDYATDSFVYTGTSAGGSVQKVGERGYLITDKTSASGKYFLYTLPNTLVSGKTYTISFDYTSWLSAIWAFGVIDSSTTAYSEPTRALYIPKEGKGRIVYRYTHLIDDKYLRLAAVSVAANSCVLIENLSIAEDDTVAGLSSRVSALDGGSPSDGTFYPYYGRRIDTTIRAFTYGKGMQLGTHQSSALYGDYLFTFADRMATIKLFNIRTETLLATVTQTELDSFHHCNQAFFGTEFYDSNDPFPLVYLTVNNDGTTAGGYMEAYRIVPTMGQNDYNAFTISLVQTVTLPIMSEANALGNANFVLDKESGFLYTYSRNNNSLESNYQKLRITKWNMPTLSQGNVVFTDADILDSWETGTVAPYSQGATIRNHLLFIFRGYQAVHVIELSVFDLIQKETVAIIDLLSNGFTMEPEGAFFLEDTLCTTNGYLYKFMFR